MKELIKKIETNRKLFTIFMAVAFAIFLIIINDITAINRDWRSLGYLCSKLFDELYNHTYYGNQMVGELILVLLLLPVLLLFKNKYIFTQKKDKFMPTLLKAWPMLVITFISLFASIGVIINKSINGYELIGLFMLCALIGMFEEFMCRGWIQNEFIERFGDNRKNVIYSIFVSALLFGVMHITNAVFGNQSLGTTLLQIFSAFIGGVAYGSIYYKSKNIWVPVFFHAFWDFAIMLGEINLGTTCVIPVSAESETIFYLFGGLIAITLSCLPEIWTAYRFLGKKEVNEELPKEGKEKFDKEELNKEQKRRKRFTIWIVVYLVIFGSINIASSYGLIDVEEDEDEVTCPVYYDREVYNAYEEYYVKDSTDIKVKYSVANNCESADCISLNELTYDYKVFINEKSKLVIQDVARNINVELKYKNVLDFIVVENNGIYDISFITIDDNYNYLVYHSDFMSKSNIENYPNFLNSLESTFSQVLLPDIKSLGTYREENSNYVYPLYVSRIGDKYILDFDGKIFRLKQEVK